MKKPLLATVLCLTAILLISFTNTKPDVHKVGEKLYKVKEDGSFEATDVRVLQEMLKKYYSVSDFSNTQTLDALRSPGTNKGKTFIERTVFVNRFEKHFVVWYDGMMSSSQDEETLLKLFDKYAD